MKGLSFLAPTGASPRRSSGFTFTDEDAHNHLKEHRSPPSSAKYYHHLALGNGNCKKEEG